MGKRDAKLVEEKRINKLNHSGYAHLLHICLYCPECATASIVIFTDASSYSVRQPRPNIPFFCYSHDAVKTPG